MSIDRHDTYATALRYLDARITDLMQEIERLKRRVAEAELVGARVEDVERREGCFDGKTADI